MIATVGDLIAELQNHPAGAPVRILAKPGELEGVDKVQNLGGRVTIVRKPGWRS